MDSWIELYEKHASLRDSCGLHTSLRGFLQEMSKYGLVARDARWFLRKKKTDNYDRLFTQPNSQADDVGVIQLVRTGLLQTADLSISAVLEKEKLREFVASISGTTSTSGTWVAAVHLHSDIKQPSRAGWKADWAGAGACTHAVYHCHVGPTMNATPKVRVPLPAVSPTDALCWLVATVYPSLEPAPWAKFPK